MGIDPSLFFGKLMHGRLFPKRNHFTYGIYYLSMPLSRLGNIPIAHNRFAPLSFYDRDHGACDGSDLDGWARGILIDHGVTKTDGEITLMCMPRVFGYVFNPVSFWLCHDKQGGVRAVLCEVHNTFRERHTYICAYDDQRIITPNDILKGEKLFHVSPFLQREGHYEFRFDIRNGQFGVWIDFFDGDGKKQLVTSLVGGYETMNKQSLRKAFWAYPLVTFKAIVLIHWQALKIVAKGIKYIKKPPQKSPQKSRAESEKSSKTDNLTKM